MKAATVGGLSERPVFVIGAARSGTTVTYSTLLASGHFPIYEAEGRLMECSRRYGSLKSASNGRRFLRDFLDSRQFRRSGLDEDEVARLVEKANSFPELLDLFMAALCRSQGKSRWAEKSPYNAFFVDELADFYPDSRFVHVVRDGRAVALSQRKLGWADKYTSDPRKQLIWIGNIWDLMVLAGRKAAKLGEKRYLEVRYEDLITDMPRSLGRIGDFIGLRLDPDRIRESGIGSLGQANSAFQSEMPQGVSSGSVERWRTELEPQEIELLDWQLGDRLREFGYEAEVRRGGPGISPGDRLTRSLSKWTLVGNRFLTHHTPAGRLGRRVPLEMGLS